MKALNFTIIQLTICLVVGILAAYYFSIPTNLSLYITIVFLIGLGCLLLVLKNTYNTSVSFSILSFITTVSIGILITNLNNKKLNPRHYSKVDLSNQSITFRVNSILKPNNYNKKYTIDVLKIGEQPVSGIALLYVTKDSINSSLHVDDIYTTYQPFKTINSPLNPNQFDYKHYLEKQYIYHQIYSSKKQLLNINSKPHTLYGYADLLRRTINNRLKTYHFNPDELAIINALILGQRQGVSKTIQNNYTNAGAIHILAVSGLHVGILLLLLNGLFHPLIYLKQGRMIKVIFILTSLWGFAIIAGLSASIIRAVTMFSIVTIALHLKRSTNIYNTLALSIFILLLFKPLFIFDIGFQLSYLAVIAIVAIQPLIVKLWHPKYKILKWLWDIFTVTLAAQFGVVPISLFYFHQFPGLFFISNLIIIPFLGFILALGILIIVLALLNGLPNFLVTFYGFVISAMNSLVKWIALQEQFIFTEISFNAVQVFFAYFLLFTIVKWVTKPSYSRIYIVLIVIICFQGTLIVSKYNSNNSQFTIFHKSKHTVIGYKSNTKLELYSDLDSLNNDIISNYKVFNNINTLKSNSLQTIYNVNANYLLVIDSIGAYNLKTIKPAYVLLRQSPKVNLERLINTLQPKYIIADGSNYKSYIKQWKQVCKKAKLPFHNTNEKGAFIITLN